MEFQAERLLTIVGTGYPTSIKLIMFVDFCAGIKQEKITAISETWEQKSLTGPDI